MDRPNRLVPGCPVILPDGTHARAYPDRDGTYRSAQVNPVTGRDRVDYGWLREFLTPVTDALAHKRRSLSDLLAERSSATARSASPEYIADIDRRCHLLVDSIDRLTAGAS